MVMRITSAAAAGRAAQPIAGEVTARGKEGAIEVLAFHHEVVTPRDTATGQASGRRQHQPIRIVKEVDRATPLIAKALYEGAVLIVTVEFYRTRADGTEERYYTYELKEVIISNISVLGYNPEEVQPAATQRTLVVAHVLERDTRAHFMEEVTFTYKTITQGHVSGVMIEDTVTG
jgi:type VI secretion system secreted protein Hcp